MLIDEDTIVDPEILQKSLSPKIPESTSPNESLSQREEPQPVMESLILTKESKELVSIVIQTSFEFLLSLCRAGNVFQSQIFKRMIKRLGTVEFHSQNIETTLFNNTKLISQKLITFSQ